MSYEASHAGALAQVKRRGAAASFVHTTPGAHVESTGQWSEPTEATVEVYAVQVRGDPERYRALELIESEAPTLLIVPVTYGQMPEIDDEVSWGGVSYKARELILVAPDSTAIMAHVIIAR